MNGQHQFINFIEQYSPLSTEEKEFIQDNVPIVNLKQGSFLLRPGQVMDRWHVVLSGCIRSYFLVNGKEITTGFFDEGRVVNSWYSFLNQEPAKNYLECIEDCNLVQVDTELDSEGFSSFPNFDFIGRLKLGHEIAEMESTIIDYLTLTTKERYIKFVNEHSNLAQRIPLNKLASYLGVRPETLSRIRKDLSINGS